MYPARPLRPLREAVSRALEAMSRGEDGAELDTLWRDRELRTRLVQALAEHARGRGAERIVPSDRASLALASPVAERLGVSLERGRETGGRSGGYLVACVLQDEEARRFLGGTTGAARPAGAGIVVRTGAVDDDEVDGNLMSIIDL